MTTLDEDPTVAGVGPDDPVAGGATPLAEPRRAASGGAGFLPLRARVAQGWRSRADRLGRDPGALAEAALSLVAVILATGVVLAVLHPSQLLSDATPTGGDMGSHVWGPRYLVDHLLPHFRLSGWTPDWYDGFPAYQFYMVVPALMVVALHVGLPWYLAVPALLALAFVAASGWLRPRLFRYRYLLVAVAALVAVLVVPYSYNRSFKVVTALGLVFLPLVCWAFAKLADLPFPIPPLAAGASLLFLFNRQPVYENTGNIIGGNFQSTMAGEFAFSISLTLAVLYLGVAARGLRTGRHRALAAVLFALAGLCHLIPAFFVLACTAALFVVRPSRARLHWLATMVPVAGLLTAFWVLPFWWRRDYVNDMGWEKLPKANGDEASVWYYLFPTALRWLFIVGLVGVVVSFLRRHVVGQVLALAWAGVAVTFIWLPQARLWNARLLPFMYLSVALLAAIALGDLIRLAGAAAAGSARRPFRPITVAAAALALAGVLIYVVLPIEGRFDAGLVAVQRTSITDPATNEAKTKSSWGVFDTTASNPAAGWSSYNYTGLEAKAAQPPGCDASGSTTACTSGGYPEYRNLVRTMAGLGQDRRYGCGRAMWEFDSNRLNGYGTTMAPMMLPYFTDGCIGSQEGLYFESSTTVPYHFLMQAELSAAGSQPQRDLVYPSFDIDAGVRHLQLLGVKYYLADTPTAVAAAAGHGDLTEVAVSGPWHIYTVKDAPTVVPLSYQPVVARGMGEGQDEWLPIASAWFRDLDQLDVPLADGGPRAWKRVDTGAVPTDDRRLAIWARGQLGLTGPIDQLPKLPRTKLAANQVSAIHMGRDTISFDVTNPGVPVLVKASYFPNWVADGADGPYRVTPNLMVVVPRSKHVDMRYARTPVDVAAMGLSVLGLVAVVLLVRRPPIRVQAPRVGRVSRWLDEVIAIAPTPSRAERGRRRGWRRRASPRDDGELDPGVGRPEEDLGAQDSASLTAPHDEVPVGEDPADDDPGVEDPAVDGPDSRTEPHPTPRSTSAPGPSPER